MCNRWALLIGVDFHSNPENRLHGRVRDVTTVGKCLEAESTPINTAILTASNPSDINASAPIEAENLWPTCDNIIAEIDDITQKATEGDFVYIHYSGHGTQIPTTVTSGNNTKLKGDFALVLVDKVHRGSYLHGCDLAHRLSRMVEKGIRVTMVLDSCFSGSISRQAGTPGTKIRTLAYGSSFDLRPSSSDLYIYIQRQQRSTLFRDGRIVPGWLIDPQGYGILTACGPHERASELFYNGERYGALSFFLCRALTSLRKAGIDITHQSMYQHLWGDEYQLFPIRASDTTTTTSVAGAFVRAKVSSVEGLTSELQVIDSISSSTKVKTGWKAKRVSHLSSQRVYVRLLSSIDNPNEWIVAAGHSKFLTLLSDDAEAPLVLFNVELDQDGKYWVVNGANDQILSLSPIASTESEAVSKMLDQLEHIARFKYFQSVENQLPSAPFEASFQITLLDASGKDCGTDGILRIAHMEQLTLTIRNLTSGGEYIVIPPKGGLYDGEDILEFAMVVPSWVREKGLQKCEDFIKVFITDQPTSFAPLLLPAITSTAHQPRSHNRGHNQALSRLLSQLGRSFRSMRGDGEANWTTRNFIIVTGYDKAEE
ncbi:hypothetical protein SI65_03656 [Aspergillus cristatus]|uniref:Peptidase C14 caspase domain-containing protein n=1 Tax=Aspergillus cristatus TaxID=573508 RepID=A0A1E3BI10_ASPCR|nr:hypothetical protein SI65_03656 [Aspergillus cristatus]